MTAGAAESDRVLQRARDPLEHHPAASETDGRSLTPSLVLVVLRRH